MSYRARPPSGRWDVPPLRVRVGDCWGVQTPGRNASPLEVFDPWTPLIHAAGLDPDVSPGVSPPSWIPELDQRRLTAYRILHSYVTNASRFNRVRLDTTDRRKVREWGDPRLIADRIVGGVLGKGPSFTVKGSTRPPLDLPDIPPLPVVEDLEGVPGADRVAARLRQAWEERAEQIIDEWETAHDSYPTALAAQRWIDQWLEVEHVVAKLFDAELNSAVPLGDAVVELGWSSIKERPTLEVFEPDTYFPVLDDATNEFPDRVHLAWSFDEDGESFVRRRTWELVNVEPYDVPYSDEQVTKTCLLTDKTWATSDTDGWPDMSEPAGSVALNADGVELDEFDLGIDFVPIIHWPNTPATSAHFGTSSIASAAQLFDDLASTDTALMEAAALAGRPTVGASGVNIPNLKIVAGSVIPLPEGGRLNMLDMSGPLAALLTLEESMLDRLSVNSQVPAVVLGRISGQDVPSGIALSLSFAPFDQLVSVLRLPRFIAYPLIPKMAYRLAQVAGVVEAGPTPVFELAFASTIPTDTRQVVENVASLLNARAISRSVGLAMLVGAGVPIEDAEKTLAEIQSEDLAGAKDMADATGSEALAAEYLGVQLPDANPVDLGVGEIVP